MQPETPDRFPVPRALVVGAGFGGLSAALLLRASGLEVTLVDQHAWIGGKARTVASEAGPVAAGPTVLTLRAVFDELFRETGAALDDHVTLVPEPLLARHFWPDGSRLDLFSDRAANRASITNFAGTQAADEFDRFAQRAEALFDLFDEPMMQNAQPSVAALARTALSAPRHLATLSPFATLSRALAKDFADPRLRQLFGRYATYVGGLPQQAPALLSLIWRAEEAGVWRVSGGMQRLAQAMADRFTALGGTVRLGTKVTRITTSHDRVTGAELDNGAALSVDAVVFNGDPRALATGLLGPKLEKITSVTVTTPRSLSARVWSFAAKAQGLELAHHNVFFAANPESEFTDLHAGRTPQDPTLYLCAEDRGSALPPPTGAERFEIILNAAPLTKAPADQNEVDRCRQLTFPTLTRFGLTLSPEPGNNSLATPTNFETLFPGSAGALYGQSPHGMTAALKRPRARTPIKGLYLAGGGTHPGAGVPMAALSGRHAAEAITRDLVST